MPICLCGVQGHIHRPKVFLHIWPLRSLLGDSESYEQCLVCFVNHPSFLPHDVSPFIPPLGPAVCGSSPLSLPRPTAGNLRLAPSESTACTPALARHRKEAPGPGNLPTRLPVPHVKDWHLRRGQLCLMSWALLSVLDFLSLVLTKAAGIVFGCCEIFWHECCWGLHSLCSNPVNIFLVFHCCPLGRGFWHESEKLARGCPKVTMFSTVTHTIQELGHDFSFALRWRFAQPVQTGIKILIWSEDGDWRGFLSC